MNDLKSDGDHPARTLEAVPPGEREVRRRRTARVLLVDDTQRLLLFADSDPGVPGSSWWITPGGGIEPGESDRAAAVRELAEETGLEIGEADLIGPLAVRRVIHGYSDVIVEQDEVFFGLRIPAFTVDQAGQTDEEQLTLTGHRWWSIEELAATADKISPAAVLEIWAALPRSGGEQHRDAVAPIDLGVQEESTVPRSG